MLWVEKIKEGAKSVLKVHPFSILIFLIACAIAGIREQMDISNKIFEFIGLFLFAFTPGCVLCEANYAYKKKIGKISSIKEFKKFFIYAIVICISIVISAVFAYISVYKWRNRSVFEDFFDRIFYVYLAVCVFGALFFMYKKHGESFELFAVKAFLGLLKAGLVSGIILAGTLCIIFVFGALFFEISWFTIIYWLITGIVVFPLSLMALSAPGEKISRFSKVVIGYVFPAILAVAFVIVYAYIIKILVTWTFPSNQVFSIMTGLFGAGLLFWTMALGCTEGRLNSILRIMPLLFIPFIIVQTMCLVMRINQYGITGTRYLGILLIIFEVIYEVYYLLRFKANKGLGGILMPLLLFFVFVYYLFPGLNVYAVITNSHKTAVNGYIHLMMGGGESNEASLARARSGYREIIDHGGLEGHNYLNRLYRNYSKEEIEKLLNVEKSDYSSVGRSYYVYTDDIKYDVDIAKYSHYMHIETGYGENITDVSAVPLLNDRSESEVVAEADLEALVEELKRLEKEDVSGSRMKEAIREPISVGQGDLYIEHISFMFHEDKGIDEFSLEGFYLY